MNHKTLVVTEKVTGVVDQGPERNSAKNELCEILYKRAIFIPLGNPASVFVPHNRGVTKWRTFSSLKYPAILNTGTLKLFTLIQMSSTFSHFVASH
jgi:hypothetical protein